MPVNTLDVQISLCSTRLYELRARRKREEMERRHCVTRKQRAAEQWRHSQVWAMRLRGFTFKAIGEHFNVTPARAAEIFRKRLSRFFRKQRPCGTQHILGDRWQATSCMSSSCLVWPTRNGLGCCYGVGIDGEWPTLVSGNLKKAVAKVFR